MAAIGKQLKQSVKVFQSLILYRLLPIRDKKGHWDFFALGLYGQKAWG
jgi:hypothetical protein